MVRSFAPDLQEMILQKITLLSDERNHRQLRVHKLHGHLKGCYAFSINHQIRIIFEYVGQPRRAYLLVIGGHDIYNR